MTGRRRTFQPRAIIAVAVVWNLLWSDLTWANAINGILIGCLVITVFPLPSIPFVGTVRLWPLAKLTGHFLIDLVRSSWQVSLAALAPRLDSTSAIIEVPMHFHSDLYLTLTAALVTLVPGSVVVEARREASVLYVHALGTQTTADLAQVRDNVLTIERRILETFGSQSELAAYRAALANDRSQS